MLVDMNPVAQCMVVSFPFSARLHIIALNRNGEQIIC
jgi:hypothetical protein